MWGVRNNLLDYNLRVKREKSWALPDMFQDLVAQCLRSALPSDYSVEIEPSIPLPNSKPKRHIQPDLLILKKEGTELTRWAIVEVKIATGFKRSYWEEDYKNRVAFLSKTTKISQDKIYHLAMYSDGKSQFNDPSDKNILILFSEGPQPRMKTTKECEAVDHRDFRELINAITNGTGNFKKIIKAKKDTE